MSLESLLILLLILVVVVLAHLLVTVWQWARHDGLATRVTRMEALLANNLTPAEIRQLFDRLASLEGQLQTTNGLLRTVQEHLLENDR